MSQVTSRDYGVCRRAGTVLVTIADDSKDDKHASLFGDTLCLLSGLFYASYTVLIKKLVTSHRQVSRAQRVKSWVSALHMPET